MECTWEHDSKGQHHWRGGGEPPGEVKGQRPETKINLIDKIDLAYIL